MKTADMKEYHKQYREEHKEEINKSWKIYYHKNIEELNKKRRERYAKKVNRDVRAYKRSEK